MLSDVTFATKGDIFSFARFGAIWRLLFNSHSDLDFKKYTDPGIWVPVTNITEQLEIQHWNEELPNINRPYFVEFFQQHIFNNNIRIESQIPMVSAVIWVYLNQNYTYEILVNDKKTYTLDKRRDYCANGIKIYLKNEQLIKNAEIRTVDEVNTRHQAFNFVKFFRVRESDVGLNFPPYCIVRL